MSALKLYQSSQDGSGIFSFLQQASADGVRIDDSG